MRSSLKQPRYFTFRTVLSFTFALSLIPATVFGNDHWGKASDGLQMRIISVAPTTRDETMDVDSTETIYSFADATQVTLLAEIKNVSDKEINFKGVTNGKGDSQTSRSDVYGPYLFEIEVRDMVGRPLAYPKRQLDATTRALSINSSNVELLAPGESTQILMQPFKWDPSLRQAVRKGKHSIVVRYLGVSQEIKDFIGQHYKDSKQLTAWQGNLESKPVAINIENGCDQLTPELEWGPEVDGLRVAAEYRLADTRAESIEDFLAKTFPVESKINVNFHFKNLSKEPIEFESPDWRQDDQMFLVNDDGNRRLEGAWYSGMPRTFKWTIEPDQVVVIPAIPFAITEEGDRDQFSHPIGPVIKKSADDFHFRHQLTNHMTTGTTKIHIRDRTKNDDVIAFACKIRFRKPDGTFADDGFVKVKQSTDRNFLFNGKLDSAHIEVEECTGANLTVSGRIPGFEEFSIRDVKPEEMNFVTIDLKPTEPATFKLQDSKGKAVAGAKVRYFNFVSEKSTGFPYPTSGLKGEVYATSDKQGQVILDSLQKRSQQNQDQPDNRKLYWFYVDISEVSSSHGSELASQFIGPIKAGSELETIQMDSTLEIKGVVKGTDAELENFSAEWDQPYELIANEGKNTFAYAVSQRLKVERKPGELSFHLTGLRPGTLRIIANFQRSPSITKTYGKREPGPSDVVIEMDLKESKDDIVIENRR